MKKIIIGLIAVIIVTGLIGLAIKNNSVKKEPVKHKPVAKKTEDSPLIKLSKKITVGMPEKEVRRIMGKPSTEHTTVAKNKVKTTIMVYSNKKDTVTIDTENGVVDKKIVTPEPGNGSNTKTDSASQNPAAKSNLVDAYKKINVGMAEKKVFEIAGKASFINNAEVEKLGKIKNVVFVKDSIILTVYIQKGLVKTVIISGDGKPRFKK